MNELVYTGLTADHGKVINMHMSGKSHVIGDDKVVAKHAVVRDVNVCHQQIAAADAGDTSILNRAG